MINELYFMRQELEGTAAWLAARNASTAELRLMRLIVDEEAELLDSPSDLGRLNYALHQTIQGAAQNRYLVTSLNVLRDGMMLISSTNLHSPTRARAAHDEHCRDRRGHRARRCRWGEGGRTGACRCCARGKAAGKVSNCLTRHQSG